MNISWKTWLFETVSAGLQAGATASLAVTVTPAWNWKTVVVVFAGTFGLTLLNRLSKSPIPPLGDGTGTK